MLTCPQLSSEKAMPIVHFKSHNYPKVKIFKCKAVLSLIF